MKTRLGTHVEVIGGTIYASGDCWLNCLYEDGTTCPIHISDLIEERPNEALIELDRVKKGAMRRLAWQTF